MNPQTMQTISNVIIFVGVLLAGLGGFGSYHFGKRADQKKEHEAKVKEERLNVQITSLLKGNEKLSQQIQSFEEIATNIYPNLNKEEAIEKLKQDYEELRAELSIQKNTIRDFSAKLRVTFSGKWTSEPYPGQLMSPVSHEYYVVLENSQDSSSKRSIKFFATEVYHFKTLGKNRAEFVSKQAVQKGSFPLGKIIRTLHTFSKIKIHIPFFLGNSIEGRKIVIEKIELVFIINGEECNPFVVEQPYETLLVGEGSNIWASFYIQIDPNVVRELFQIRSG